MNCLICNGNKFQIIYKEKIADILSENNFKITDSNYSYHSRIVECMKCGFIFSNPRPTQKQLANYYSKLKDQTYLDEEKGRGINFSRIIETLARLHPKKGKILDVGCASGIFLNIVKKRGWKPYGIDPSKWLIKEAKDKYKLKLVAGDILTFDYKIKFDAITLIDVLEHVDNPKKLLEKCHWLLKDDGILVIVTPNIKSKMARFLKEKWWHIRVAHISYFDENSLNRILNKTGFLPILKKTYQWNFSFNYWYSRIKGFSPSLYKFTKIIFTFIPNFNDAIGKRIISINFKDSFEWYCAKINYRKIPKPYIKLTDLFNDFIITTFFIGKFPLFPALMSCLVYMFLNIIFLKINKDIVFFNIMVFFLSTSLSLNLEQFSKNKYHNDDPREFTLDEIAGLSLTYILLPIQSVKYLIIGFLLFRIFDLIKLWPIRFIEKRKLKGKILFDDIFAGFYAIVMIWVIYIINRYVF